MYHKLTQFCIGSLLALFALLFTHSTQANSLVNDPFIRQHIDKSTFEPGGQNHLFGSARGSVADRKGDIYIIPTASIQAGGVSIDQAVITGNYQYNARFSGHEHDEHSPFANSNSKEKTAEQGITGVDFTSLSMQWQGKEVHPADAYDGKQGSGYPTPTGARDEYSYTVAGSAIGARLNFNDNRTAKERLKDRKNAIENARNTITDAFEQGLTHNPNLNKWGNAAEVGSAVAKGLGAAVAVPFEWLGASDAGDGIATAKDLATLEAMRELSHENKLKATDGLETVQKWQDEYNQWRAENPNKAAAADTAINTAETLFRKGGDRVEAKGDRTTGSRGGNATDTGHTNASGQTIYQRDSGGYYSNNPATGTQQSERSPYPHGNTLDDSPTYVYQKYDKNDNFLKNGITNDPKSRYNEDELAGGYLQMVGGEEKTLPRDRAAAVERFLTERNPGPENKEPWAGKVNPNHPNYDPNYVPMHKRTEKNGGKK